MIAYRHCIKQLPIGKEDIEKGKIVSTPNNMSVSQLFSNDYYIYTDNARNYYYVPKDLREQSHLAGTYDKIMSNRRDPAFREGTDEAKAYHKGYGSTHVVREGIIFGLFFFLLLFGAPWAYYFLTGDPIAF